MISNYSTELFNIVQNKAMFFTKSLFNLFPTNLFNDRRNLDYGTLFDV